MNREIRRRQRRAERRPQATPRQTGHRRQVFSPRNLAIAVAVLAAAGLAAFFVLTFRGGGDLPGEAVESCGSEPLMEDINENRCREHVAPGEEVQYNTNPPVGGPHDGNAVNWGVYTQEPLPTKEQLVHNMEHGGVIIWHRQGQLTPEQVDELTRQAAEWLRDRRKIVMVPYEEMDVPLALTHWGRIQKLPAYDLQAVKRFVEKLEGPGPERNIPFAGPVILPAGY